MLGRIDLRTDRGPVVAGAACRTSAGNGVDDASRRVDAADSMIVAVGEDDAAVAIDHHPRRPSKFGRSSRTSVATEAGRAGSGDSRDDAGHPVDTPQAMAIRLSDDEVAVHVEGNTIARGEIGRRGLILIARCIESATGDGRDAELRIGRASGSAKAKQGEHTKAGKGNRSKSVPLGGHDNSYSNGVVLREKQRGA